MKEFDINKIENDDSGVEVSELLTGAVTKGLSPKTGVEPNAEIERGEYLMYPDGTTQKVVGQDHEKGGVPMNIPDGTIIITNNLKPKAKDRKVLEKEFDISIPKTATYAQVVDKFIKKIGLSKLYEEQEEAYEQLKKIVSKEGEVDEDTNAVNKEFISKKIYDIEQQKQPKEEQKRKFVEYLFGIQESNKKESNEPEEYKYGGLKKDRFEALCKKNGMSVDEGLQMLKYGGVKKYQDGGGDTLTKEKIQEQYDKGQIDAAKYVDLMNQLEGSVDIDPSKINFNLADYESKTASQLGIDRENVQKQSRSGKAYSVVGGDIEGTFREIQDQFPRVYRSVLKGVSPEEAAQQFDNDTASGKKLVEALQKGMNKEMKSMGQYILDNKDRFDQEEVDFAEKYVSGETFVGEPGDVRSLDSKLGEFTATRRALGLNLVTPEEREKLAEEGIFTAADIVNNPDTLESLSEESKRRIELLGDKVPGFKILDYEPQEPSIEQPTQEIDATEGVEDLAQLPRRNYPRMFYTPDQRTLPPTNMLPHLRTKVRLGRIDPVKVGVEQNLQNISDTRQFTADQLRDMNPQQRAGALAALTASSQQAENQAITQANRVNAQNQAQAELFNIGQSDREQMQDARSALDFERRQYTARDRYDQNLRDWFLRNQKVALSDYDYNRKMNLVDSLFPDYTPNFYGNQIEFDPETEFNVQNRGTLLRTMGNLNF